MAIGGSDLISAIYRTDLVPVPVSLELVVKSTDKIYPLLQTDKKLWTATETELIIVKSQILNTQSIKDGKRVAAIHVIAILSGCEALISVAKRATSLKNTGFNEVYRALGAKISMANDIKLNQFICLKGQLPTERIALSLQKESTVIRYDGSNRISAIRLNELFKGDSKLYDKSSVQWVSNPSVVTHGTVNYLSIDDNGSDIVGDTDQSSAINYYPQADARELKNLKRILVTKGIITRQLDEYLYSGKLVSISSGNDVGQPFVVLTSAHRYDSGAVGGKPIMATKAWLAQIG